LRTIRAVTGLFSVPKMKNPEMDGSSRGSPIAQWMEVEKCPIERQSDDRKSPGAN